MTDLATAPDLARAPACEPASQPASAGTAPPCTPTWSVLCVDDEPSILAALKRALRAPDCRVLQAGSGAEALEILAREKVDVLLSDMRMPGMDGATLLAKARAHWPQMARILLTGYADMKATVTAINEGQIYRYIHKPWDELELRLTVRQAAEHQRLESERADLQRLTARQNEELRQLNASLESRIQERTAELKQAYDRLKHNYLISIRIFSSLMELRSSVLSGSGKRVAVLARRIALAMDCTQEESQDIFVASLLHDIGFMALSDALLAKPVGKLQPDEMRIYQRHPVLGAQALTAMEDHHAVAQLIRYHHERFDGGGFPEHLAGKDIPLGARIIALVDAYDDLTHGHLTGTPLTETEAKAIIQRGRGSQFDPEVVDVFMHVTQQEKAKAPRLESLSLDAVQPGMRLGKDLLSREGFLLLSAGHVLNDEMLARIRRYEMAEGVRLTLEIRPDA